jgi:hypothetical protein
VYVSKRVLLAVLTAALSVSSLAFALQASANHAPRHSITPPGAPFLAASLAPSLPAPTDPTIHGVAPGGAPWGLSRGSAVLRNNGRVTVEVDGLVLTAGPSAGTAGPVTGIAAALYCGADSNTTAAAATAAATLSSKGDGVIRATVTLPSSCLAPIVLVHPMIGSTLASSVYIAITGVMH